MDIGATITPDCLLWSAINQNLAIMELMLDRGYASIDHSNQDGGDQALSGAVETGNFTTVEYLVDRGADVNFESKEGTHPLDLAISYGWREVALFLISRGAKTPHQACPEEWLNPRDEPIRPALRVPVNSMHPVHRKRLELERQQHQQQHQQQQQRQDTEFMEIPVAYHQEL